MFTGMVSAWLMSAALVAGDFGQTTELETAKDSTGKITRQYRVTAQIIARSEEMTPGSESSAVNATGPGSVTILQFGLDDLAGVRQGMRTTIDFQDRMTSTQPDAKTHKSKFMGNVFVTYAPADSLDTAIEAQNLPKGGLVLQSDMLTVYCRDKVDPATKENKTSHAMQADNRVSCWTSDVYVLADSAVFDELQENIVFKGSPGNPVRVFRKNSGSGDEIQRTNGQTIIYNRKTGTIRVDGRVGPYPAHLEMLLDQLRVGMTAK